MASVKVVGPTKFLRRQWSVRALLLSWSLVFGDRANDQLAFAGFDEWRISLRLGSIKQFLNFQPAWSGQTTEPHKSVLLATALQYPVRIREGGPVIEAETDKPQHGSASGDTQPVRVTTPNAILGPTAIARLIEDMSGASRSMKNLRPSRSGRFDMLGKIGV